MDFNELDTITPEEAGIDTSLPEETPPPVPPADGPVHKILLTLFIILFFALTLVPMAGMLLDLDGENAENRRLAQPPALITRSEESRNEFNGQFSAQYEEYIADNFGFRQEIVSGWSALMYRVFGASAVDSVMVGKDGWLYYSSTRESYEGSSPVSDRTIFRMAKTVELLERSAADSGAVLAFAVAPNKATVYPEYLPAHLRRAEQTDLDRLSSLLTDSGCWIDLTTPLIELKQSGVQCYYRLDSHWNNAGALEAYRAITDHFAKRVPELSLRTFDNLPSEQTTHTGDLSTMLMPQLRYAESEQSPVIPAGYTSESPITNRLAVSIRTTCPEGVSSLCMMRDSFGSALIDSFSTACGRVHYDRALPYDLRSAIKDQYKLILIELVERNLIELVSRVPIADAPPCQPPKHTTSADMAVMCTTSSADGHMSVSGVLESSIPIGDNDCIYVEFRSGERSVFFEAFPIAEGDGKCDRGFALSIPEAELLQGEYTLHLHVGTPDSTVSYELYQ